MILRPLVTSLLLACVSLSTCVQAKDPVALVAASAPGFASSLIAPPANADGTPSRPFQAHYNFPATAPDMAQQEWMKLDPRNPAERTAYYEAILKYGLSAFQSDIRNGCPRFSDEWYHMPWMTVSFGASPASIALGQVGPGREPLCGLTQERTAPEKFLHPLQTRRVQKMAVGTFNATGANLLGQIWKDRNAMDLSRTTFANGTFIVKFLFTEATAVEVPYLLGAPQWQAYIYRTENDTKIREQRPMLLAQIDFGVREPRADNETGWV
jgi:hypothetical protein